jgi:ABC-2 family transporter
LPSRNGAWTWLLRKEWRDLVSSRSWWVMFALMGPLVGVSFINAVRSYAEASGQGGTAAALSDTLFPLDGVVAPTFSAYEIAASFLLPFVAIRAIAGDRQSGALKLELQQGMHPIAMMGAKGLVLGLAWLLAGFPIVLASALWVGYGGSLYPPELMSLLIGHVLNAGIVIGLAAAAASLSEHPSTAAILVLTFTVGTWVLSFVAAFEGGLWEQVASYTPSEMLQAFRRGLIRLDLVIAGLIFIAAGFMVAAIWMRLGAPLRRKTADSIAALTVSAILLIGASFVRPNWDVSENQRNSFSESQTAILSSIREPLRIRAHLAPEDPRRFDLEQQTLSKLRRTMPNVAITYVSQTSTGLFEQANANYGELWYDLGGKKAVSQITTPRGVLDTIYELAGVPLPQEGSASQPGHPLVAEPVGAFSLFYIVWPLAVLGLAFFFQRRRLT